MYMQIKRAVAALGVGLLVLGSSVAHAEKPYPVVTVGDARLVLDLDTVVYFPDPSMITGDARWCDSRGSCAAWRYGVLSADCHKGGGNMLARSLPGAPLFVDWHALGTQPTDLMGLDVCVAIAAKHPSP